MASSSAVHVAFKKSLQKRSCRRGLAEAIKQKRSCRRDLAEEILQKRTNHPKQLSDDGVFLQIRNCFRNISFTGVLSCLSTTYGVRSLRMSSNIFQCLSMSLDVLPLPRQWVHILLLIRKIVRRKWYDNNYLMIVNNISKSNRVLVIYCLFLPRQTGWMVETKSVGHQQPAHEDPPTF